MELTRIPFIVTNIFASSDNHLYFNSNFEDWFKSWIGIKTEIKLFNTTCWRQHKNSLLYSEILSGINSLVLNLPLIFVIELSVGNDGTPLDWNIPQHLEPLGSDQVKKSKLIYDLIGFGLMNEAQNYFIAHYQDESITGVTTYDGMQNHRKTVQVSNLYSSTYLSGISPLLSPGYF